MNDIMQGAVFRCPVCGAELTMLSPNTGGKCRLRCCNTDMEQLQHNVIFYVCPVCGAEIGVLNQSHGHFEPRCCDTEMVVRQTKVS